MPQRWSLGKGIVGFSLALRALATLGGRSKAPSTWGKGLSGVGCLAVRVLKAGEQGIHDHDELHFLGTLITEKSLVSLCGAM